MADPINIKFPMRVSSKGGFETNDTTIDAITDDLKMLLMTNYGERMIHYDFGANLRSLLFEPDQDTPQKIIDNVTNAISTWMPFVNIMNIEVETNRTNPNIPSNAVSVNIRFSAFGQESYLKQSIRG
jgi:phage baseplate assembly protein W